jgi:hypothetical protein
MQDLYRASRLLERPNPDLDEVCELVEPPLTKAQKRAIATANAAAAADITLQSDGATPGDTSTDDVAGLGVLLNGQTDDDQTTRTDKPRRRRKRHPNRSNQDS